MKLVYGEAWEYEKDHPDRWICITTNGSIKANGENVMGSGVAKEWRDRNPGVTMWLGEMLRKFGNTLFAHNADKVITFPTKNEWNKDSDIGLIKQSSIALAEHANRNPDAIFVLPRPGVGAGKLKWEDVEPVIAEILPDNVHVITWG